MNLSHNPITTAESVFQIESFVVRNARCVVANDEMMRSLPRIPVAWQTASMLIDTATFTRVRCLQLTTSEWNDAYYVKTAQTGRKLNDIMPATIGALTSR